MAYPTYIEHPSKIMIRYSGLFDFEGLYNVMVNWLKSRGYWFHEHTYKHKVPSPYGAEQEIGWKGEKEVTDYYKFIITVSFHLWDMTEVDVEKEGEKKKLTNARMEIILRCAVEIDYEKRFAKSPFWKFVSDWYHKYVMRRTIENVWVDTVYHRLYNLQNVIKEYLDMEAKGNEYEGYMGDNV